MKKILYVFVLLIVLISSCEDPLNHNFVIVNKTNTKITVNYKQKNYENDSIKPIEILKDSSQVFFIDSEMQGFFTGKIPAKEINSVFDEISIFENDSTFYNINLTDSTIWKVDYNQGVYTYFCTIKN